MIDVAIVGAGPAGSWAAYLLARSGARVQLFDPSHPREKPCGGGVTGRALAIVNEAIGTDSLPAVRIRSARFLDHDGGDSVSVSLDAEADRPALVVMSRRDFDGRLAAAAREAGAELIPARVADVTRDGNGFRLTTADGRTFRPGAVVGADGPNSLVRRRLARPFRRDQLSIATGYFAHGTTSDEIVIDIVHEPPGYIWSFPRTDHLAIGICAQADQATAAALRARTERWIAATAIAPGARLERYSWPIPSLSAEDLDHPELAGAGWFLIGDAAGLVDPVTREGIYFALDSARLAAKALASATDPERAYCRDVREQVIAELSRAARLKAGFFRPRFTRLLVVGLSRSETIRRVMADLIAGTQGYHDLAWRLARTMELRLAWEFLRRA